MCKIKVVQSYGRLVYVFLSSKMSAGDRVDGSTVVGELCWGRDSSWSRGVGSAGYNISIKKWSIVVNYLTIYEDKIKRSNMLHIPMYPKLRGVPFGASWNLRCGCDRGPPTRWSLSNGRFYRTLHTLPGVITRGYGRRLVGKVNEMPDDFVEK